jgi:hypothetical protein
MIDYMAGLMTMGHFVAGLFFLRFWRRTGDGLFLAFCLAFWLFALNSAGIPLSGLPREEASWFYLLRLAGFGLIIAAILAKNAGPARRR